MRTLGALLLNPPITDGRRTRANLEVAARILGCSRVEIANLFSVPTQDVTSMNPVAKDSEGWLAAHGDLSRVIASADVLLGGWGVRGLSGSAARQRRTQILFVGNQAGIYGRTHLWTVGGQPRHPSRWHQFVSDRYGRTPGGLFDERLKYALQETAIADLVTDNRPAPQRDVTGAPPWPVYSEEAS